MDIKKIDIVDVISMTSGKCGSTTLKTTFLKNGYKSIKTHSIDDFKKQYDGLIELINNSSKYKKVYLIDVYRTPIERKISSFFQNIKNHIPDYKKKKY